MFDIGSVYWFKIKGNIRDVINLKGKVIEENSYLVKIELDDKSVKIITQSHILDVNEVREKQ